MVRKKTFKKKLFKFFKISFQGDYDRFAKLLSCGAGETRSQIIDRERTELNKQLAAEGDQPESCFILEALKCM